MLNVAETIERAERAARLMAANGFTRRAHPRRHHTGQRPDEHRGAGRGPRDRVADVIDVEIVALSGGRSTGPDGRRAAGPARRRARRRGRPRRRLPAPRAGDRHASGATEVLLEIAAEHGVGVDLHTDETLDAERRRARRPGRARRRARVRPRRHRQPLRQPRAAAARVPAASRRGGGRGRHQRRGAPRHQPLPPGPRPPGGDAARP